MDKLISQQAAINVVSDITTTMSVCTNKDECYGMKRMQKQAITELSNLPTAEPYGDAVSRNAIVQKLNGMDRYVSTELRLCDTDKKFPQNEVFIVDDVYEEIVEQLPSIQPDTTTHDSIPAETGKNDGDRTSGDCISRTQAIDAVDFGITYAKVIDIKTGEVRELFKESNKELTKAVERIKQLPSAQPERKDAIEKAVAVEAISDELMSRFDISATYAYEIAEKAMNRIEAMAKEIGKR